MKNSPTNHYIKLMTDVLPAEKSINIDDTI